MFIKKRVLTEKTSKMFDYVGAQIFVGKCISVTNEHFVTLIKGKESICVTVWTHIPIDLWTDKNHEKISKFYESSKENKFNHQGIIYCGSNNFVNSGFVEIDCKNISNNKAWLVIDILYDLGSIIKNYISNYMTETDVDDKKMFDNLKERTKKLFNNLYENSKIMDNTEFFDKFKYGIHNELNVDD